MPPSKLTKTITIATFILPGLFMCVNLAVLSVFAGRAWPGATLGGQSVGGLTASQIKSAIDNSQNHDGSLNLKIESRSFKLAQAEIGTKPDTAAMVAEVIKPPSQWLPIMGLWKRPVAVRVSWRVNSEKLTDSLKNVLSQVNSPAADATVVVVGEKPTIVPGTPGTGVELNQAKSDVTQALAAGSNNVEISPGKVAPNISETTLQPIAEQMKKLIGLSFKLTYQGKSHSPDKATVGSWLGMTVKDGQPVIVTKPDAIKAYLAKVAKSVDVKPKNKIIDTVNGEVRSTTEGADGLAMNQEALVGSLSTALLAGNSLTTEITTQVATHKTVYNKTYNLDFGKYIEVNLSTQHMWVYQDHQVVFESAITSGAPGRGHPTVQGLFNIYTKQQNRYLDGRPLGYNYNVYVQYWMPFHKDYGLHDASWRSSFGGSDYYYGGSHGCVNMPIPAAAWLYNWADVGTPVWVHS